jgi:AcrR family transcriptional regulator
MSRADAAVATGPATEEADETRTVAPGRSLSGEKAQRIVEAMRRSVAKRGSAGSTFDHVSREAGVSRGLLHYYFGTKEQLLVEAVRRDCELRLERLQAALAFADSADGFVQLMVQSLQQTVVEDPDFFSLVFELFTLSRRNEDIKEEYAGLIRQTREQVGAVFAQADREGLLHLRAEPEAVAEILFSLADGFALRMLSEPERDFSEAIRAGMYASLSLLTE